MSKGYTSQHMRKLLREHKAPLKLRIQELEAQLSDTEQRLADEIRTNKELEAKLANYESDAYVLSLLTKLDEIALLQHYCFIPDEIDGEACVKTVKTRHSGYVLWSDVEEITGNPATNEGEGSYV